MNVERLGLKLELGCGEELEFVFGHQRLRGNLQPMTKAVADTASSWNYQYYIHVSEQQLCGEIPLVLTPARVCYLDHKKGEVCL